MQCWILGWIRRWRSVWLVSLACLVLIGVTQGNAIAQLDLDFPQMPPVVTPRDEIRGVWMTTNDLDVMQDRRKVREAMGALHSLHFNTLYPVIWNSGYVLYPSPLAQRMGIQPFVYQGTDGHDILADVTTQAHQAGLLVIPWFEFGLMTPPTSELALNRPEWLTQKQTGEQTSIGPAGEVAWLNPFHPEVQKFITDLVLEAVTRYSVDGIQFDDNMSLPREFGYDPYTIALYRKETKKAPPKDVADAAWMKWRADKITVFMSQLQQAIKRSRPQAIVSVAPNYYDFAYKFHLQDWLTWVRKGLVDELVMQVYRSDYGSFVSKLSRPEIQETQQRIPTAIGILAGLRNKPVPIAQIQEQVRAAQDRGLGVAFFYYESLWNESPDPLAERLAGFQALFPTAAPRLGLTARSTVGTTFSPSVTSGKGERKPHPKRS